MILLWKWLTVIFAPLIHKIYEIHLMFSLFMDDLDAVVLYQIAVLRATGLKWFWHHLPKQNNLTLILWHRSTWQLLSSHGTSKKLNVRNFRQQLTTYYDPKKKLENCFIIIFVFSKIVPHPRIHFPLVPSVNTDARRKRIAQTTLRLDRRRTFSLRRVLTTKPPCQWLGRYTLWCAKFCGAFQVDYPKKQLILLK